MSFFLLVDGAPAGGDRSEVIVPWWSFTKTALAATALSLVRDGLVGLDDRVEEGPFTLRQLLRHEAGLADYGELAEYHAAVAGHEAPWPASEMLRRLDADRLRYMPGDGWRYSNVGYLYVVRLIERVTGLGLAQALAQCVLSPLGLEHVRLATMPTDLHEVNLGAIDSYDPGWVYHGLLVGSLADAAILLERLLVGDLLPSALLREMQTVRTLGGPISGRPWQVPGYALGLMQGPISTGLILSGHTGGGPGSVMAVYRGVRDERSACCAVFHAGGEQGVLEDEVVARLLVALE